MFLVLHEKHKPECRGIHEETARKLGTDSVISIFHRSDELFNVFYRNYIGAGYKYIRNGFFT